MSYLINNQQKLNDIIFANRNKNYGAYVIRSVYGETVLKSLSIMAFGTLAIMYGIFYFCYRPISEDAIAIEDIKQIDSIYVIPFNLKQEKRTVEAKKTVNTPALPKLNLNEKNPNLVVKDSVQVNTIITTELNFTATINSSLTGTGSAEVNNSKGSGDEEKKGDDKGSKETKLLYEVDSEPEFEGGLPAITRFIQSKVRYPEIAVGEGKTGTVYVKFVVDETGKVTNLNLLNSLGYGLDDEALRVVGLLPKFKKPGMVQGKPVKVYYQLPIRFSLR
jgi:periplasmic protein TonB